MIARFYDLFIKNKTKSFQHCNGTIEFFIKFSGFLRKLQVFLQSNDVSLDNFFVIWKKQANAFRWAVNYHLAHQQNRLLCVYQQVCDLLCNERKEKSEKYLRIPNLFLFNFKFSKSRWEFKFRTLLLFYGNIRILWLNLYCHIEDYFSRFAYFVDNEIFI